MAYRIVITLTLCAVLCACDDKMDPLSDEFIDYINANQTMWRAGRNFDQDTPSDFIKYLMGTIIDDRDDIDGIDTYEPDPDIDVPKTFDARIKWPDCNTLNDIRDQGSCGSCWAVSATAAMTDRICINSKKQFYVSDTDVLTCCKACGYGCNGGKLKEAWLYYKNVGIVSGGPYASKQGCRPYEIEPCYHTSNENRIKCGKRVETPNCRTVCETTYSTEYLKDRHRGSVVNIFANIKGAQVNLIKYGPITSTISVYADFVQYKSGVYKHVAGDYEGQHSVKIIGWGEENGNLYWLVANSWNTDWGDKGFFKILRGVDHCGIETNLVAGK